MEFATFWANLVTSSVVFVSMIGVYVLPSAVARGRGLATPGPVYVANLLLGWTVVGWLAALALAVGVPTKPAQPDLQDA